MSASRRLAYEVDLRQQLSVDPPSVALKGLLLVAAEKVGGPCRHFVGEAAASGRRNATLSSPICTPETKPADTVPSCLVKGD